MPQDINPRRVVPTGGPYHVTGVQPELDDFTRGYVEAALWVNDPESESGEYVADLADAPEEYVAQAVADCAGFQQANADDLARAGTDAQNGHDFYLTRNGHGGGFWDRGYGDVGDRLSAAAKAYGESWNEDLLLFDGLLGAER